jgi:ribosomal protein L29
MATGKKVCTAYLFILLGCSGLLGQVHPNSSEIRARALAECSLAKKNVELLTRAASLWQDYMNLRLQYASKESEAERIYEKQIEELGDQSKRAPSSPDLEKSLQVLIQSMRTEQASLRKQSDDERKADAEELKAIQAQLTAAQKGQERACGAKR